MFKAGKLGPDLDLKTEIFGLPLKPTALALQLEALPPKALALS